MTPLELDTAPRWFQSQFEVRLPLANSPLAAILPVLVLGVVLLLLVRLISARSDTTQLKGMLLVSVSLLIGYGSLLTIDDAAATYAYWLSLAFGVIGLLYVLAGARRNPGRDIVLLLSSGILLIVFSAYSDLSIWLASTVDQARCHAFPGIVTCIPRNFNYLLVLTGLWILPASITTANAAVYLRRMQKESAEFAERRSGSAQRARKAAPEGSAP